MEVSNRANSVDIRAVVGADALMLRRETLQVPVRRHVRLLETFLRQEVQTGSLVTSRHDDDCAIFERLTARPVLGHALSAVVEADAILFDLHNVTAEPFSSAVADLV